MDALKENHLRTKAFYEAFGLGGFFLRNFWDGFATFDDYEKYGDMFPRLEIKPKEENVLALPTRHRQAR